MSVSDGLFGMNHSTFKCQYHCDMTCLTRDIKFSFEFEFPEGIKFQAKLPNVIITIIMYCFTE